MERSLNRLRSLRADSADRDPALAPCGDDTCDRAEPLEQSACTGDRDPGTAESIASGT